MECKMGWGECSEEVYEFYRCDPESCPKFAIQELINEGKQMLRELELLERLRAKVE